MEKSQKGSFISKKVLLYFIGILLILGIVLTVNIVMHDFGDEGDVSMYVVAGSEGRLYGEIAVHPHLDEVSGNLYFFLPGKKENSNYRLYIENAKEIRIGDSSYKAGDRLEKSLVASAAGGDQSALRKGNEYELVGKSGVVSDGRIFFICGEDVETIYITSGEKYIANVDADVTHKTSATAAYEIYDSKNIKEAVGELKISGHGNSTWKELIEEFPGQEFKRSYDISFDGMESILGMNPAKKYVLLSNFYDESEVKNYLALDVARKLDMNDVPECEYANLYINGKYRGLYLVTQKIKENNGMLGLHSDGYLAKFDYEDRVKDSGKYFVEVDGLFAEVIYPKEAGSKKLSDITLDLLTVEAAIRSEEDTFKDVADEESFIKYYLIQEFLENGDADRASQYVYKAGMADKLSAGPVWDFDLAMGHPWFSYDGDEIKALWIKGIVSESGWLRQLSSNDIFMDKTYRYYEDYFSDVIDDEITNVLPGVSDKIGSSFYMDMVRYERSPEYYDKFDYEKYGYERFDSSAIVGVTGSWLEGRKNFWDDYVKNPDEYEAEVLAPGKGTKSIRRLIIMKNKRKNIK